jgi:hypothetical protein
MPVTFFAAAQCLHAHQREHLTTPPVTTRSKSSAMT